MKRERTKRPENVHCVPAPDGTCSICSDEAVPGVVLRVDDVANTAEVEFESATETVALDLIDGAVRGDTVLVHMGFALSRIESDV